MNFEQIENLVIKAKNDDVESIEILYCSFIPFITIWSSKLKIPNYSFEDLKQECFIYLMCAIEKYQGTTTFVSYATQTIKNNLFYLLREQLKEDKNTLNIPFEMSSNESVENFILKNIEASIIEAAINSLTSLEQRIIKDYYFNDLNLKQISLNLDLKYITTVKKKDKALLKLNKLLNQK